MYTAAGGGGTQTSLGAHVADEVLRIALAPIVHDVLSMNPSSTADVSGQVAERRRLGGGVPEVESGCRVPGA